jgi:hypothetical protein
MMSTNRRVRLSNDCVADDQADRRLVDAVQGDDERRFEAKRVAHPTASLEARRWSLRLPRSVL